MSHGRIGADPELFATSIDTGEPVPVYGLIGGTKDEPIQVPGLERGFTYQEDGAAVEFNIPPAPTGKAFCNNIRVMHRWVADMLAGHRLAVGMVNSVLLSSKYLSDERSQYIGCSSDHDAYGDPLNTERPPFSAKDLGPYRYAGGHIHVQYNTAVMPAFVAARYLDLYLGLPSIRRDRQGQRRQFYGKAGIHRPKSYGVEYRTLSNYWLFLSSDAQVRMGANALNFANSTYNPEQVGVYQEAYTEIPWADVQKAIASEDFILGNMVLEFARGRFGFNIQG